jgi:parallel beta-helix repeat protein
MTQSLPSEVLAQISPLLGSLARMVARGSSLGENTLQTLLLGAGLESDPTYLGELQRWGRLLLALRAEPVIDLREATVEALLLRGLPEASVLLAVDAIMVGAAKREEMPAHPPPRLTASVASMDLGRLPSGEPARGSFEVQGGPGQILVDSDHVHITPRQFGPEATRVEIHAQPLSAGVLWTTLKLVTPAETLELPLVAHWHAIPSPAPAAPAERYPAYPDNEDSGSLPVEDAIADSEGQPASTVSAEPAARRIVRVVTAKGTRRYPTLAVALQRAPPGATIHVPEGIHELGRGIVLSQPVTLIGQGAEVTEVVADQGESVLLYEGTGLFQLSKLTVRWAGSTVASAVVVQSGRVRIEHCAFTGATGNAEVFSAGLWLAGKVQGLVASCRLYGNTQGIAVLEEAQPTLRHNTCEDNEECGISYFDQSSGTAFENTCADNGMHGIFVGDQAQPDLERNVCQGNQDSGIAYFGSAAGIARQNACRQNEVHGINVSDQSHPALAGNECQANERDGIYVESTARPRLDANQSVDNGRKNIADERRRGLFR